MQLLESRFVAVPNLIDKRELINLALLSSHPLSLARGHKFGTLQDRRIVGMAVQDLVP